MNSQYATLLDNGPLIQVNRLSKSYSNGHGVISILRGISLEINLGEMVAVMGPSGSGKSTFLFILGLLLPASSGDYYFLGQDVLNLSRADQADFRRRRVGFVFQNCDLFENSTVYENLEFPLIYAQIERQERPEHIVAALERVNLANRLHHPANLLSGGERQRVAVARALVNQPQVILADEPTGQLDRQNGIMVMDYFNRIVSGGETSMVIVTHDPQVAARCHRVFSLEDGLLHEN
ncbi:MAG: ABC transporter ATP-binding protein [Deltaproteobacteria bacterium]|nr:MAG: ABC transporter ATP-binding protein [Deltaproteobacteria bacterium]